MNIQKALEKMCIKTYEISNVHVSLKLDNIIVSSLKDAKNNFSELKNNPNFIKDVTNNTTIIIHNNDEIASMVLEMFKLNLDNYLSLSIDAISIDKFLSDLVSDKIDDELLLTYTKKFKINRNNKVLYVVKTNNYSGILFDTLSKVISNNDYIFSYDSNIIIIKEEDEAMFGNSIVDIANTEAMVKAEVGYSNSFNDIKDIKQYYFQAKEALSIGQIFPNDYKVYGYGQKKMTRLIYNLPKELMIEFLNDYANKDALTSEDYTTIHALLQSNLNVAEASRKLYVHRNTLIYRIEKINKETGLNIQDFEDAMVIKMLILIQNAIKLK